MQQSDWFSTSLGQSLLSEEKLRSAKLIPSRFYLSCLQVGLPLANFLKSIDTHRQYLVETDIARINSSDKKNDPKVGSPIYRIAALGSALPFTEKTHDLIVLPHTLDFYENRHKILRQISQILIPEGCVCIIGFNALSLYGLIRFFQRRGGGHKDKVILPWQGKQYRIRHVQDCLFLLGFDLVGAEIFSYQPPLKSEKWRKKLTFLDHMGSRWWPGLGGVYIIVVRKK